MIVELQSNQVGGSQMTPSMLGMRPLVETKPIQRSPIKDSLLYWTDRRVKNSSNYPPEEKEKI